MPKQRDSIINRRHFLKGAAVAVASTMLIPDTSDAFSWTSWDDFIQPHYKEMRPGQLQDVIKRMEREYKEKHNVELKIKTTKPIAGVQYGYALDLSKCIGCRRCVYACVKENNHSRDPQIHWITVLRFEKGRRGVSNLEEASPYYNPDTVPEEESFYMPVQCQQCERPPCVKACPTQATWQEDDGIIVVDYNWCIGCRYCMAACPYGARRFNWAEPFIPKDRINVDTHYLGNRIRYVGVVDKCTFCIQRTRETPGRYPACVEICPVGARKFGNLNDPHSEVSYIIEHERVFRLKEELNTSPKFFYFFSM